VQTVNFRQNLSMGPGRQICAHTALILCPFGRTLNPLKLHCTWNAMSGPYTFCTWQLQKW